MEPVTPVPTSAHRVHLAARPRPVDRKPGLSYQRRFCPEGVSPWSTVEWEQRDASITDAQGRVVFEQHDVEVPVSWSVTATNVVVSKYFRGHLDTPRRETSIRQLIARVVDTIARWGLEDGYFVDEAAAAAFNDDLAWLCLHQHLSFNSPVWFNVGDEEHPQCSACFINSVKDSMESILDLVKVEGMLFKFGSGAGTNLSVLRSCREGLRSGGFASGPVSFMRGFDAFAGVIKSGGATRRAAKMVILDIDHPDILDFISCKAEEEKKAWALIDAGYDGGFNVPGGAYDSVLFQNANNSVRVSDDFMRVAVEGGAWQTRGRTDELTEDHDARGMLRDIAAAAWICGDPGLQFDTTINRWHTCPETARINASNPCSEYMFLDDSACNLASLNVLRFRTRTGSFDTRRFRAAVRTTILAQEIIVDRASYPTEPIEQNSMRFRPLGLGYANLGALLMASGLPYDSDEGRAYAAAVTALMQAEAYLCSAQVAAERGPFAGYAENREAMAQVIRQHQEKAAEVPAHLLPRSLYREVQEAWTDCETAGQVHGYRNAQVSVLAPTGTIGFMMDCDTTGVEPDIALVKYKKLVGGGMMKIVNRTVPEALSRLGYNAAEQAVIAAWLETHETIEGAPGLKEEHLPVFDCAFRPRNGARFIGPMGHLKMMASVQPFISGAISKTVNIPEHYTPEDIEKIYLDAWKMGLKAISVYRDNCKRSQPLNLTREEASKVETKEVEKTVEYRPVRHRLPDERAALTHKFSIGGHDGYVTVGMYEDGSPGEVFIVMAKEGSVVSGLMDGLALAVSMALQYGVPLRVLCDKFSHTRFEPSGFTGNPEIPIAKSVLDYIFRWLELRFLKERADDEPSFEPNSAPGSGHSSSPPFFPIRVDPGTLSRVGAPSVRDPSGVSSAREESLDQAEYQVFVSQADAPPCQTCGSIMVRSGTCYKCFNCGMTSGCS